MKRARGFAGVWAVLGIVALGLAGIAGLVHYVGKWQEGLIEEGRVAERLEWQSRESVELTKKNATILALEEKYRALEKKSADDIASLAADHQAKIKEKDHEKETALADARAGRGFGLRWKPITPASEGSGGNSGAAPGADPGGDRPTSECRLPQPVTDALIGLASDADKVVEERNTLLALAAKDREVCR